MADIRVNALPDLPSGIAAEDILHILDASTTDDVDSQVTVDAVADWIIANKSVRITGIDDVPGLRAALDGKADIVHTHTVAQVIGLQEDLDAKTDVTQAQIIGRNIVLNGKSINVPSTIGGLQDDRIPDTVVVGEYLQFGTTGGGINNITGDDLKGNLALNLVDNTTDASKPVSTAQQAALDLKVDTTTYTTGQAVQDTNITANTTNITANATAIAFNTQKVSFDAVSSAKLDGIEALADVTDTENVWGSLGISGSGSTGQYLTQRGVFVGAPNVSVNKSQIDAAIGASPGGNTTLFYNQAGAFTAPEGGDDVTKQAIDNAIGVFPTGDSAQFYNEQGNFVDAVYDSVEDAPIIRNRTIESIVLSGTRSNVQARLTGVSELSIITIQNTFDSSPTQYTTTFTSPNTTLSPSLVFPAGSQGRQLSLTEADGTLHRFCYLVNGNYRLLAGGLTGTVRLGPVAVATTATVTAAVTVPDQTAGQTITLVGDETGTFAVGDFISPQANNFGAYRGIFIDSITFDGTNTVIVGPSNGATTFNTTSVLRNAGPATEIQGTIPTFSGDPDTANTVYSSSIPATEFTVLGVNTSAHLIQVANAFAALETAITTDGIVTDNGDGTSSITIDYNTETNIDSSFTITGGLNNMESIVNVDGMIGDLSPATTITLTDPEATEVVSFTSSAADTATENVDDIAAQLVLAVNNNVETPINFDAEYDQATKTIILTAESAGNTNPWTIVFDNNGVTNENAGNLGYTSSQTGEVINYLERILVSDPNGGARLDVSGDDVIIDAPNILALGANVAVGLSLDRHSVLIGLATDTIINAGRDDRNFIVRKQTSGDAINYDSTTDTLTTEAANIVGFGGGADGLSITDTVNLNLLDGTTVLSTVVLPSSSGTTVIAGTANQIVNTVSGDTNTLSLAPAITDAITANTAKTGITTAQAAAITSNTGKTGITVEQSNAIIANTSKTGITTEQATAITNNTAKTGITTAQASAIVANTAKVSNVDILPLANTFTALNTFDSGIVVDNITGANQIHLTVNGTDFLTYDDSLGTEIMQIQAPATFIRGDVAVNIYAGTDLTNQAMSVGTTVTTFNGGLGDRDFQINKMGGPPTAAFRVDAGADVTTIGSDVLTINSTTINGLPSKADALSISGQVLSLLDGTTVLDTVTLPSGGTATTVQGTSGQIGVSTVGNTATVSLDTAIASAITANTAKVGISTAQASAITANTAKVGITTAQATAITNNTAKTGITTAQSDAITANTAKVSVAGLNQVGAAVLSTDSVVYYAGAALAPRRKVFSSVPLSIFNNDAGFSTNTGTVTSVTGTANQINVTNGTTTPVVSLNNTITNAITANTSKTGITTAQSNAITANTAKITYPASASTKLGTIETNADVTDKANVDTAIGTGGATTDYYASDKTWKTIPSAGVGDAVLANNQTFTGVNVFNNTAGGIQARRITAVGDVDTYLDLSASNIASIKVDGNNVFQASVNPVSSQTVINNDNTDMNFVVRKQTTGSALTIDAGTDTFTVGSSNIVGVASSETGTWTPTWVNNGTLGTQTTTYSKVGDSVTVTGECRIAAGTSNRLELLQSSLPFAPIVARLASGSWWTSIVIGGNGSASLATASGIIGGSSTNLLFLESTTSDGILSTDVSGFFSFTLTYQTT